MTLGNLSAILRIFRFIRSLVLHPELRKVFGWDWGSVAPHRIHTSFPECRVHSLPWCLVCSRHSTADHTHVHSLSLSVALWCRWCLHLHVRNEGMWGHHSWFSQLIGDRTQLQTQGNQGESLARGTVEPGVICCSGERTGRKHDKMNSKCSPNSRILIVFFLNL